MAAQGWVQGNNGTWTYGDGNGGLVKNAWKTATDGKWYYLGNDGIMLTNASTPDGYRVDSNGAWDGKAQNSQAPITPTATAAIPAVPDKRDFSFTGNLNDYVNQAHDSLAPLLQSNINKINDQYVIDSANANNDTLRRGLSRSTYAGNRQDQVTQAKNRNLSDAQLNNDIQANQMASSMYNTAYDRAYNLYKDDTNYDWQKYGALVDQANTQNDNAWKLYHALLNAFNTNTANQQWQKTFDQNQSQWQQTFDYNKAQDERNYQLALKKASSGRKGRSGGSSNRSVSLSENSPLYKAYQIYHSGADEQTISNELQNLTDKLANNNSQAAKEARSYAQGAAYQNYINYKERTGNREYQ